MVENIFFHVEFFFKKNDFKLSYFTEYTVRRAKLKNYTKAHHIQVIS